MTQALTDALLREWDVLHGRLRKSVAGLDREALDHVPVDGASSIAVIVTHTLASQGDWLHIASGRSIARDRDAEFRTRGRNADELLVTIDRAAEAVPDLVRAAVDGGVDTLRRARDGRPVSAIWCLLHALQHTTEHVGQAELTRQLAEAALRTSGGR